MDFLKEIWREIKPDEIEVLENGKHIDILIEWGDWKHEHRYCDILMRTHGYICDNEVVIEEDGSDYYCAWHYYSKVIGEEA